MEFALDPEISRIRYKFESNLKPEEIVPSKRKKKMPFMEWNEYLKGFYKYLLEELDRHLQS